MFVRENDCVKYLLWQKSGDGSSGNNNRACFREVCGRLKVHSEYGPMYIGDECVKDTDWVVMNLSKYTSRGLDHRRRLVLAYPYAGSNTGLRNFAAAGVNTNIEEFTRMGRAIIYETGESKYAHKIYDITYDHPYTKWFARCFDQKTRTKMMTRSLFDKLYDDDPKLHKNADKPEETLIELIFDNMNKTEKKTYLRDAARKCDKLPRWCKETRGGKLELYYYRIPIDVKKDTVLEFEDSRKVYEHHMAQVAEDDGELDLQ